MRSMFFKVTATVFLCLSLCACNIPKSDTTFVSQSDFCFSVLKAGQADAIILKTENHTVLIDCGEKDDGSKIVSELRQSGTEKIDYMFITHFDKDHVGGAPKILKSFSVDEIVVADYEGNNDEYCAYKDALESNGLTATRLSENMTITLDDVVFDIYPSLKKEYNDDDNDFSLVISAHHGDNSFLFAGDAVKDRIAELNSQIKFEHSFLKVPHHGKYGKATKKFIKSVSPRYAVITDSEKNPADTQTLAVLNGIGCETYETKNGDITVVSDGKTIKISQ